MKLDADGLVHELSQIVDPSFARSIISSYVDMQQRFLAGDWQPAELDAGRLCEAVSRALLQLDTETVSHQDLPGAIRRSLLDNNRSHHLIQKDREHILKVIDTVYKFRSDRGAVHISPIHDANFMDSMFVLHAGKWLLAEFLRIAWNRDQRLIGQVIEQLVQVEYSFIHELDGKAKVTIKGISAADEILLLLQNAPSNRLSRADIRAFAEDQKPDTLNKAIIRLNDEKTIRIAADGDIALTQVGQSRVMTSILPKYSPHA